MEKHKIFISGLPFSCTKEQLAEISKNHGTVKEVRLVTYRSGKPKVRNKEHSGEMMELVIAAFDPHAGRSCWCVNPLMLCGSAGSGICRVRR